MVDRLKAAYSLERSASGQTIEMSQLCGEAPIEAMQHSISGPQRIEVDPSCKTHWWFELKDEDRVTGAYFIQQTGQVDNCEPVPDP